jgi:hypothetical protein
MVDRSFLAIAIVVTVIVVGLTFFAAVAIQVTPQASAKEEAAPAPAAKDTPADAAKADPVTELNLQIERFNANRSLIPDKGISPIEQRVSRVEYEKEKDEVRCYDARGAVFLTLQRQPDGRFKGILQVKYHELVNPERHSWGTVQAEFWLPGGSFPKVPSPAAAPSVAPTPPPSPAPGAGGEKLVPLAIQLPKPLFEGTPKNIKAASTLEKPSARPLFMVPEGLTNLALGKPVTSSDSEPIIGDLAMVTDGDKSGSDGSFVELGPGKQHVQIDLQQPALIYAIVVWHYHGEGRVYHDIIVQVADDADFARYDLTLYNNDFDNSSGLGLGKDLEYMDDYRGRLIDAKGVKARYVRVYSNGNTSNDQNHYVEVEVYGKAPK